MVFNRYTSRIRRVLNEDKQKMRRFDGTEYNGYIKKKTHSHTLFHRKNFDIPVSNGRSLHVRVPTKQRTLIYPYSNRRVFYGLI